LEKIKVLIADDHALIREGLRKILATESRVEVIAEAKNGEKTIEYAFKFNPNIILMDINMPGINGISATKTIKKEKPQIGIIALTLHDQEEKYLGEFSRFLNLITAQNKPNGLTKREVEVLQLIAQGESNRSIAQKLYLSEKTVKNHITSIFQKLDVVDRTQATLYAIKNKIAEIC